MRKVAENLWVGNAFEARDMTGILAAGIQAVMDLAIDEPPIVSVRDLICLRIPLIDGAGNSNESLKLAISTACQLLQAEIPTLIACSAGMSRSPAIAAAALTLSTQTTLNVGLAKVIAGGPCDISPSFLNDVRRITDSL